MREGVGRNIQKNNISHQYFPNIGSTQYSPPPINIGYNILCSTLIFHPYPPSYKCFTLTFPLTSTLIYECGGKGKYWVKHNHLEKTS